MANVTSGSPTQASLSAGSTAASSSAIGRVIGRIIVEWLIWLPVWLVLTTNMTILGKVGMIFIVMAFFAGGLLLYRIPAFWRRMSMLLIIIALIALSIAWFANDVPIMLWLGILLWRGRYLRLRHPHYGLAFGICCAAIIITSQNEAWADHRLPFILLAVFWMIVWFITLNRSLIEQAGLYNDIVTGPVKQASRKYLLLFLMVGVLIIALTANYGQQLLTPKHVVNPNNSWIDPNQFIQPPQEQDQSWMEGLVEDRGKPSIIWDILFWIMTGLAACGLIWFARLIWKDRTWTWRGMLRSIREWFLRENKAENLPYVEERRSLLKEKKKGPGRFDSLFRRQSRGPSWEQLSNPEKVRRLYEEAVLSGIEQGYDFKPHHTPSETLERLEQWRLSQAAPSNEKHSSYWTRLMNIKTVLLKLYEKAKYSPHEVTSQEVGSLREQYPDKKG